MLLSSDYMETSPEFIGSELCDQSGQVTAARLPADESPLLLMETVEQNLTACPEHSVLLLFFLEQGSKLMSGTILGAKNLFPMPTLPRFLRGH